MKFLTAIIFSIVFLLGGESAMAETNTVRLQTEHGDVMIKLFPEVAPKTVQAFKDRVSEGFYDGIPFHRVIPGFVAQGGDPELVGRPRADYTLKAEFSDIPHKRGTLSMARLGHDIHSASTQFYIVYDDQPHLDGQYTVFGEVTSGMEVVDQIGQGDKMVKLTME